MLKTIVAVVAAWLVAGPAAAQPAPKPPANDDCLACHGDADAKRDDGRTIAVDAQGIRVNPPTARWRASIVTPISPRPRSSLTTASWRRSIAQSCHDDIASKYHDSIHAWAKEKAGLVGAPACADCHGTHDIRQHTDTISRVYRTRVPETCGSCHRGINEKYAVGVHAAALKKGNSHAPGCVDCHTTHAIKRVDTDRMEARA